ncbi:MAG: hypothetical protein ACRD98_05545 [Nitrososphaera sp.]
MPYSRLRQEMRTITLCVIASVILVATVSSGAYAERGPEIILKSSFIDAEGRENVVGTVRNFGGEPVQVTVGLRTDDSGTVLTSTYGRTVWPLTDSPFKFVLEHGTEQSGDPFIAEIKEATVPLYEMLVLTYDGMAVGEDRAFVGKVKNTGPFELHNVSVFAAVHSPDHKSQLDTVRSNVIPVIRPGEELEFIAIPDPMIKPEVLYYSCAGLDFDAPIPTLDAGNGELIPFALSAFAKISSLRYDNAADRIAFVVQPYGSNGVPLSFKIPQLSENQTVSVTIDGKLHDASVKADGRTIYVDFFVPSGEHEVYIQGVRSIPELPFALVTLASVIAAAVTAARFRKAVFKIS